MRMGLGDFGGAFLPCLLVLGCGGGGSIPLDQLGTEFAAVFCQKAFICCDAGERSSGSATMTDEATCRSIVAADVSANLESYQTSINRGGLVYHGDIARRCLDTLAALPCAQWGADDELRRFPDCVHLTEGKMTPGAPCISTAECAADGFCDGSTGVGVCAVAPGLGESCPSGTCRSELACLSDTTTCGSPLPDGSPCLRDSECASALCVGGACGPPTVCNGT